MSLESENKYNIIESFPHKIITSITNKYKVVDCQVVIRKPDAALIRILLAFEVQVHTIV